jgi:hypothetical protein
VFWNHTPLARASRISRRILWSSSGTILMTSIVTYGSKSLSRYLTEGARKMRLRLTGAVVAFLGSMTSSFAQTAPPAPSIWKNQSNSILEIESVDASGVIKGSFTNHKVNTDCLGVAYPVEGHILPTGLFFAVTFPPCFTVATWQGTFSGNTIQTNYMYDYVDGTTGNMTPVSGSDTFTQLP